MKLTRFEDLKVLAQWDFLMMIRQDDKSYPLAGVISSFEKLRLSHRVKQVAHKLSLDITELLRTFPRVEKYDLAKQIRRCARSIPSDISLPCVI